MPFLGFGQSAAMLSGIYADLDICGISKYERNMIKLRKSYYNLLSLREQMEDLQNSDFDKLVNISVAA